MTSSELALKLGDSGLFVGERLCLDFINTACLRLGEPMDFLESPEAAHQWLASAQRIYGDRAPGEWSVTSLPQVHDLRAALWEVVDSLLEQRAPSTEALGTVNAVLRADSAHISLEFDADGFKQSIQVSPGQAGWMAAVALDAVDLLTSGDLSLVRQCECEGCVRVFYDTTKNHNRRWCVQRCGNRVKAANYYRRKREAAQAESSVSLP